MPAPTLHGHLPRKLDSAVTGLGNQELAGSCSRPAIYQRCLAVCHLNIVSTPGTKVAPRAAIPGPPQLAQWGHLAPLVSFRVVRDTREGRSCGHSMALPRNSHLVQDLDVTCGGPCWVTLQGPPQVCPTLPPFSRTFWKLPGSRGEEDTPLATCWWTWRGELGHMMVVWGSGGAGGVSPDPPQGSQQEWASGMAEEGVRTDGSPPLSWGPLLPAISALLENYRQPTSSWMQADDTLRAADQVGPHQGGPGAS